MFHPLVDPVPYRRRRPPRRRPFRRAAALALALSVLVLAPAAAAYAQDEPAAGSAPAVEAPPAGQPAPSLAGEIERSFEVLPTRDGLLLRPLDPAAGYRAVEVEDGEIAIDGELLEGEELAGRLGAEAEPVRRLAALGAGARALFVGGGPEAEAVPETGAVAPTPEVGAISPPPPVPPIPRPPRPPRVGDVGQRVSFASSVTVDEDEVADVAVAIGGNVRVDGEVEGEAVAIGGDVRINGHVGAEAVAVGGSVYLGPHSVVEGDVSSVGGKVVREEGSRVDGQVSEVSMRGGFIGPGSRDHRRSYRSPFHRQFEEIGDVVGWVAWVVVLILLVGLVTLIARQPVERVAAAVVCDLWPSLLAGFLFALLFIPVLVVVFFVLLISVIGIPLVFLLPFAILVVAIGVLLGVAGVARAVGRWLERRFGWADRGAFLTLTIGLVALHLVNILASGLDVIGGPLELPAVLLWLLGLLGLVAAAMIGFGAVLLTRFGAGPRRVAGTAPPPLPPEGYAESPTPPTPAPEPGPPPVPTEPAPPEPVQSDSIFEPEPEQEPPAGEAAPEPAPEAAEEPEPAFEPDDDEERKD